MKPSKTKYEEYKVKDRIRKRIRKRKVHSLSTMSSLQASSSPNNYFPSKQSFVKPKAGAAKGLPKSPGEKKQFCPAYYQRCFPIPKHMYLILKERVSYCTQDVVLSLKNSKTSSIFFRKTRHFLL